jgi:hypothetical protein
MLIAGISRVGPRTPYASRAAAPRASQTLTSAPASSAAEPVEYQVGEGGEADDLAIRSQQLGMTLAAAQAAYASN